MITGIQIRMARAALNWSAAELAKAAGVGLSTVQRMETAEGYPSTRTDNLLAVRDALLATGKVRFEGENGVCFIREGAD